MPIVAAKGESKTKPGRADFLRQAMADAELAYRTAHNRRYLKWANGKQDKPPPVFNIDEMLSQKVKARLKAKKEFAKRGT